MAKWKNVPDERKKQIFAYNAALAQNKKAAEDFKLVLNNLPPGQVKNLLKIEAIAAILKEYGISEK